MAETLSKEPKDLYTGHSTKKADMGKAAKISDLIEAIVTKTKGLGRTGEKTVAELAERAAPLGSKIDDTYKSLHQALAPMEVPRTGLKSLAPEKVALDLLL